MSHTDSITLDAQTALEIREYLAARGTMYYPSDEADRQRWIAALTPQPRTVPDGPLDQDENGEANGE